MSKERWNVLDHIPDSIVRISCEQSYHTVIDYAAFPEFPIVVTCDSIQQFAFADLDGTLTHGFKHSPECDIIIPSG